MMTFSLSKLLIQCKHNPCKCTPHVLLKNIMNQDEAICYIWYSKRYKILAINEQYKKEALAVFTMDSGILQPTSHIRLMII